MKAIIVSIGMLCMPLLNNAFGTTILVPEPDIMIEQAEIIASGSAKKLGDSYFFTPDCVYKGEIEQGRQYLLYSMYNEDVFSIEYMYAKTHDSRIILLATLGNDKISLSPVFGLCSAWPQGTTKDLLKQRTLEECITFVESTLKCRNDVSTAAPSIHSDEIGLSGTNEMRARDQENRQHKKEPANENTKSVWIFVYCAIAATVAIFFAIGKKCGRNKRN